jgi:hypothetical protein
MTSRHLAPPGAAVQAQEWSLMVQKSGRAVHGPGLELRILHNACLIDSHSHSYA